MLRGVDRILDLSELHEHLAPYYSHTRRPSIDPELVIRMLLVGYCFGIRQERRQCEEENLNLAYRWFCRLSIEDAVPDHSTFSKNRHDRFRDAEAFRYVFEQVLERCIDEALVGGESFAIDASVVSADANRRRHREDDDDEGSGGYSIRAVREYLTVLDETSPATGNPAKRISATDPAARWTKASTGPGFYGYSTNYLMDTDVGIIVDVEPTQACRPAEVQPIRTMNKRVEKRFDIKPQRLIGDMAYGTAEVLGRMVDEKAIEPHVPLWEKGERNDGTLSRSDFVFDAKADRYTCPQGQPLLRFHRNLKKPRSGVTKANTIIYRASAHDCEHCRLEAQCCPITPSRKVTRSVHEAARNVVRRLKETEQYRQLRHDRKKVEMLFGHMKLILKLDRLRLRGMSGAKDEFLLTATVQNLRRMAL